MTGLSAFLVTAASGDLAEAVAGVLRKAYPEARLYGIDAGDLAPARLVFDDVERGPLCHEPGFLPYLASRMETVGANFVVPCLDHEIALLAEHESQTADWPLLLPRRPLIPVFADKYTTFQWLQQRGLSAPRTWLLDEAPADALPLVVKPRRSSGSANLHMVRTPGMLAALANEFGNAYVAQEHVGSPDSEFTCPLLRVAGETRTLTLRRTLHMGRTVRATVERLPVIDRLLERIAEEASPEGPLNVQLRLDSDGQPRVFEINPRFSSTVKMRHMLGFRDLEWMVEVRRGNAIPPFEPPIGAQAVRLSREVVLSHDDACGRSVDG